MPQEFDVSHEPEPTPVDTGAAPERDEAQTQLGSAAPQAAAPTELGTDPATSATEVAPTTPDVTKAAAAPSTDAPASDQEGAPTRAAKAPSTPAVGDRIRGRIVAIDGETTSVECAGAVQARIATAELRDRKGDVLLRVDDRFTASVAACEPVLTLTLGKKRGVLDAARLRLALENRTHVKGTVQAMNKGGFEIRMGRVRAFCPLSQIDAVFVEAPASYLGKSYAFRVLRWENHGRNIVVSRRSVLREEAKLRAQETRKQLAEGAEVEGVVNRMATFGAFVEFGGLEGLLHVSRMSHGRIDDPASVVKAGDKVRVRIVKIEHPGTRRERISLELADLGPNPWEELSSQVHEGQILTGTVARIMPFGAFVHLPMGLDGLVHVSELSPQHVAAPQEVVTPGQEVQVRVLHVDKERRRISLSMRRAAEAPKAPRKRERERRERPARPRDKGASPAPGAVSLTHTMADQLGVLKDKLRKHA